MLQWAQMAVNRYDLKAASGIQLSTRESHEKTRAEKLLKSTISTSERIRELKRALDTRALECITMVGRDKILDETEVLDIFRLWPCNSINCDMMTPESMMLAAPIPSLYPMGTQRELISVFGMMPGRLGSHVSISDETVLYPNFTRLLTLYAEGFSEERFGQIMAYTTITLANTTRKLLRSERMCWYRNDCRHR